LFIFSDGVLVDVSVVIPCYNRERTIGDAVRSALDQTIPVREVIVVDDGSQDNSARVAQVADTRVRVICTKNGGAAAARNRGIAEAVGEWIAFLDSDDTWSPEHLELQRRAIARFTSARLVFSDTVVTTERGEIVIPSRFALGGLRGAEIERDGNAALYDRSLFLHMLTQSRVITSAVTVHRALAELRFPEYIWGSEDWALWLTLVLRYPFLSVDRITVRMTRGTDNLTGNASKLRRNDVLTLETLLRDEILTPVEKASVEHCLAGATAAALYSALAAGEPNEARRFWSRASVREFGFTRYLLYGLASLLPANALRWIARNRGLRTTSISQGGVL
jgi:glycosyltransferase involved in cell wall biosynthesis